MSDWHKAAELQLELHRWMGTDRGQHWLHTWVINSSVDEEDKRHAYDLLIHAEPQKLLTAQAIWVSPEMCEIVQVAKEGFQPETLEATDFLTMTGFLYFAKPVIMRDRNDHPVSVGAVSWCPIAFNEDTLQNPGGMSLCLYSSAYAEEDRFSDMHKGFMQSHGAPELIPLHITNIRFGDAFDEGDMFDVSGAYTGADQWWKTVQVSLRLMQQRISVRSKERAPRPSRRRWERMGYELDEIMVVRLRRPASKHNGHEEHEAREWTHQWLVDGHWRNQWYPSLNTHRQIYISPYVKGPEDKPLVVKRRIYKWDR